MLIPAVVGTLRISYACVLPCCMEKVSIFKGYLYYGCNALSSLYNARRNEKKKGDKVWVKGEEGGDGMWDNLRRYDYDDERGRESKGLKGGDGIQCVCICLRLKKS